MSPARIYPVRITRNTKDATFRIGATHSPSASRPKRLGEEAWVRRSVRSAMIGLVGISPPADSQHGTVVLTALPRAPAEGLSAVIVRPENEQAVGTVLAWFERMVSRRLTLVLGLVCPPDWCAAALGAFTHPVRLVLPPEDLEGDCLPAAALATVRNASVEGLILDELHRKHGDAVHSERTIVGCLISHAVRGGTLNSVAADLGCSTTTIWRRLRAIGVSPRATMSRVRLRAYELQVELGADPGHARRAGGWYTRRAWKKALARGPKADDNLFS